MKQQLEVRIADLPEVLQDIRRELASVLLEAAEDEAPAVARRLRRVAAAFEAGCGSDLVVTTGEGDGE